jgi:cytochrome c-type biogenesis protein CcmF
VFWGTVFPVLSEWVRGVKITVGPPFFNRVNAPLGIALMFLMGVGPVIAWRKASAKSLWRSFATPMGSGLVIGALSFVIGAHNFYAVLAFSVAGFALSTVAIEFWRGMRVRQTMLGEKPWIALSHLIGKNRRRYGGYIVHVGVTMVFIGIVASAVFKLELQRSMKIGDSASLGGYTVRYDAIENASDAHVDRTFAHVSVFNGEGPNAVRVGEVLPEKRFYKKPKQPTTEVSIWSTLGADLYVVLGSYDPQSQLAVFQVYVNPLIGWMWIGGFILALGTAVCMWPSYTERAVVVSARVPAGSRPA